jgi:hypothetical protein
MASIGQAGSVVAQHCVAHRPRLSRDLSLPIRDWRTPYSLSLTGIRAALYISFSARHLYLIFRGPRWLVWHVPRQSSSRRLTAPLWRFLFPFHSFYIAALRPCHSISFVLVFRLERSPIATLHSRTHFIALRLIRFCVRDILAVFPTPTFIDHQFLPDSTRRVLIIELLQVIRLFYASICAIFPILVFRLQHAAW